MKVLLNTEFRRFDTVHSPSLQSEIEVKAKVNSRIESAKTVAGEMCFIFVENVMLKREQVISYFCTGYLLVS